MAVPWLLLSTAERRLSSSLAGLLVAAVPLLAAVLAAIGGEEHLGWLRASGLLLGMAGVIAVVGVDVGSSDALPAAELAVVVVCYSVGPRIAARRLADVPLIGTVAASVALCSLAYLPAAVVTAPGHVPSAEVLAAVAVLGAVCTALAFVLFFHLISEAGPARAMLFTYVNPAVAVLLGVAFLGETFGPGAGAGFVLILAGCWLASGPGRQQPVAHQPEAAAARGVPPASTGSPSR
jgi:drug/metabolite transporter (DMT)-like permease